MIPWGSANPIYHSGGEPGPLDRLVQQINDALLKDEDEVRIDLLGNSLIALSTQQYAPGHTVTIRTQQDGPAMDLCGQYRAGNWFFRFDPREYPESFDVRFFVDGQAMTSPAIEWSPTPDSVTVISDSRLTFPPITPWFHHGIDNLDTSVSRIQRELCPGNRDESVEYDVIIVGSGMGGGVLADALSDSDVKTLVLEAGGLVFPTHIDSLPGYSINFSAARQHEVGHYINKPNTISSFVNSVQMNLGGRSVYWEGLIPRMADWELQYWPQVIASHLQSANGYESAEKLVRKQRTLGPFQKTLIAGLRVAFPDCEITDLPRSLHQPNLDSAANSVATVVQRSTGTFSTADLLLDSMATDPFLARDYLQVNLNHLVTELDVQNDRICGVACQDLVGNKKRTYRGKYIVLAAGSLESPRIAMASGLKDPNQMIGVGLTDHPAFVHPTLVPVQPGSPYSGKRNHAKILIRRPGNDKHPYTTELTINPHLWDVRHSDDDILELAMNSTNQTFATVKFLFDSPLNDKNSISYLGSGQKLQVKVLPNTTAFAFRDEVVDFRNRIFTELTADFDPCEPLDYHGNGSVHHAGGTLRTDSCHRGVVDENLRFESYDNLYCCDVSVFPRIPTANPSLTLISLAQRLSQHLKNRLGSVE
ncbi:MAG: GMC oxidoreductase [Rubripirellula sp.]